MEKHEKEIGWQTLPEALGNYALSDAARFHMPGHKGRGMGGFWRDDLIRWDVTELSCTDNLHCPSQAIADAERRMAAAYGASASFLVVNGATAAVQAMLLSLDNSDRLLLSRDAHRCAVNGAALRDIPVDYILPAFDESTGLWGMVTPKSLDEALKRTRATAVLLTSPNYYGFCADIKGLSDVAHAHGALLLVDGAHGAHFPFSDALPTPLGGHADLFAHSQHKTMDALTQSASLHLGPCRIQPETVRRSLAMVETSSPSYLLMSSLDWSVYMGARQDWSGQVRRIDALRERIAALPGIALLPATVGAGVAERDRTRLVLDVTGLGLGGYAAQSLLERSDIYVEMADTRRLVLITSPEDDPAWYARLVSALSALSKMANGEGAPPHKAGGLPRIPDCIGARAVSLREATFAPCELVPLKMSEGRIAAAPIGVYPPGIALAMPGEYLTRQAVRLLCKEQESGAALFGVANGCVRAMREQV